MFKNFSLSYFNFFAMVIIAILFSFDAFSKVSNGELRQITKQFTNNHHPECNVLFRTSGTWTQVKGDVMVCSNRLISSFDKELNKLYKQVMERYEIFPKKYNFFFSFIFIYFSRAVKKYGCHIFRKKHLKLFFRNNIYES